MKRTNELIVGLAVTAVLIVVTWSLYAVGDNMPRGVTPFSRDVYQLHMTILGIVTIIGILVFAGMFTSIVLHRKSRGVEPAKFTHSTRAEIAWTVIPVLILIAMAVPSTRVLIDMHDTGGAQLNIKITGYQWLWKYDYLEDGISFYSMLDRESNAARQIGSGINPRTVENYLLEVDNPLVLPTNTRIRFLMTSGDVIHAWWVPALGWKRDTVPGMVNEGWTEIDEPGTYRGQCAELCGKDHGFMPIVVEAVTPEEFELWLAEQKAEAAAASLSLRHPGAAEPTPRHPGSTRDGIPEGLLSLRENRPSSIAGAEGAIRDLAQTDPGSPLRYGRDDEKTAPLKFQE